MSRREFYRIYYNRTDRVFADKIIWTRSDQEEAWRKRQRTVSKMERKGLILSQYASLLLCFVPLAIGGSLWVWMAGGVFLCFAQAMLSDFSIIKIELLYAAFRKKSVYASMLYTIFLGGFDDFLTELKRATKKRVIGYFRKNGGKFCGKYSAICRNGADKILLTFRKNKVIVRVNGRLTVLEDTSLTREQLLTALAAAINEK